MLSGIHSSRTASDSHRMSAATSIDITVTRGSSTPCADQIYLNVQHPDTGIVRQYPAKRTGSCLKPLWHVSMPIGMSAHMAYKCWPSRDTDNSQSIAMLSNGQIAYNKCGAEVIEVFLERILMRGNLNLLRHFNDHKH